MRRILLQKLHVREVVTGLGESRIHGGFYQTVFHMKHRIYYDEAELSNHRRALCEVAR